MKKGITLVELLAALVISAVVVTIASRVFLSGNRQFHARVQDSNRLARCMDFRTTVQNALNRDISRCGREGLWLDAPGGELSLDSLLRGKFPELKSVVFNCYELNPRNGALSDWQGRFQPRLIEYRTNMTMTGKVETMGGSVLK